MRSLILPSAWPGLMRPLAPLSVERTVSWVSVDDYMPDDEVLIMAYAGGEVVPAWHDDSRFGWQEAFNCTALAGVTHWCHLPQGPEAA